MNATQLRSNLERSVAGLKEARDQLRVDLHLAGMDLRARLKKLERRLHGTAQTLDRSLSAIKGAGERATVKAYLGMMELERPSAKRPARKRRFVDVGEMLAPPRARRRS
jgi:hypothetical protein